MFEAVFVESGVFWRTMEAAVQKNVVGTQAVLIDFPKPSQPWIPSQHHRAVTSVP
jgi:hypothetical protein